MINIQEILDAIVELRISLNEIEDRVLEGGKFDKYDMTHLYNVLTTADISLINLLKGDN